MTRQGERPKQRVPNIYSSVASFFKHLPGIIDGVQLRVHVDELGRQEGVLVEAILQKMAVDVEAVGEGDLVGARQDQELVGALGGVGFLREEAKRPPQFALFAQALDHVVLVGGGCGGGNGGIQRTRAETRSGGAASGCALEVFAEKRRGLLDGLGRLKRKHYMRNRGGESRSDQA